MDVGRRVLRLSKVEGPVGRLPIVCGGGGILIDDGDENGVDRQRHIKIREISDVVVTKGIRSL